jgi:hypothetical protein
MKKIASFYVEKEILDLLNAEALRTGQSRGQIVERSLQWLRCREQEAMLKMLREELDKRFAALYEYIDRKIADFRDE